jgi:hypothetical protein
VIFSDLREAAMLNARLWWLFAFCLALVQQPSAAEACGGFFCGRLPVDQTAERIVFKVNPDSTTMITQIAYAGAAPDFAWVLPLGAVPDVKSLGVFPQRALTALDANTGPQFTQPSECSITRLAPSAAAGVNTASGPGMTSAPPPVTVHYRAEVGPYDVAAIESKDPMALYDWLRENSFNVNDMMLPYIRKYTDEGMKFIALKLQKDKDTTDIQPFRFDLPGTSPSIPLRMTALAAEPEMSILVFVFADERYNGANWPEVKIQDDQIVWSMNSYPIKTNWAALVARGIDEAGGQGWVTELANSTVQLKSLLTNSRFNTPDDMAAGKMLNDLIGTSPYLSRLYARMSAEEMTADPIFHKDAGGNVSNIHMLSRYTNGVDQCAPTPLPPDPCLFTSCGAGGICRPVMLAGSQQAVAGCGCLAGATARTTFDPASVSLQAAGGATPAAAVICQDVRMSFVNPGDKTASGENMTDPCVNFDCGVNGNCLAMNMTPTCVCDEGFVAVGSFNATGGRTTTCQKPMVTVPMMFYQQRLPELPKDLPGGRVMKTESTVLPVIKPRMADLGSNAGALPAPTAEPKASSPASGGCHVAASSGSDAAGAVWLGLFAAWFGCGRRGRHDRRGQRSNHGHRGRR